MTKRKARKTKDELVAENLALRLENAELKRQLLETNPAATRAAKDTLDTQIAELRGAPKAGPRAEDAGDLDPYEGGETAPVAFFKSSD